ncbi:hypothetical protein V12B01_13365 [Vibrio splendidus 12B01]|nr:hypothetical protein V12B01_13365 [Vibrio splendidus 12B01]
MESELSGELNLGHGVNTDVGLNFHKQRLQSRTRLSS